MLQLNYSQKPHPSRLTGIFLVLIATACWGTSGIFIFNIVEKSGLSAIGLAFWRDLISSLILLIGILIIRPKLLVVKKKDIPWLVAMGVISIGAFHIFWNLSILSLGASLATVIQGNAPVFVTILARVFFKESLNFRKILAILAAGGGTVLAAGSINGGLGITDPKIFGIAILSALTYGSLSLFGKKLAADYNPWTITFYVFAIGTMTIFIFQGARPEPWPTGNNVMGWILGFVLMATILGFGLYAKALQILPASIASITATAEILFAVVLANLFLGERLGGWQILGALLIIIGVVLVSFTRERTAEKPLPH